VTIVVWVIVVVVIVGVLFALFGWDRYRGARKGRVSGAPYEPTDEVFIDPATGRRMRVWYNANSGERDYRPE
jgi:hypothetical protein